MWKRRRYRRARSSLCGQTYRGSIEARRCVLQNSLVVPINKKVNSNDIQLVHSTLLNVSAFPQLYQVQTIQYFTTSRKIFLHLTQ